MSKKTPDIAISEFLTGHGGYAYRRDIHAALQNDYTPSQIDAALNSSFVRPGPRGIYGIAGVPFEGTAAVKTSKSFHTTPRRSKTLDPVILGKLAEVLATDRLMEFEQPSMHHIRRAAQALNLARLPGNIAQQLAPAVESRYYQLIGRVLQEPEVIEREVLVTDTAKITTKDLLTALFLRQSEFLSILKDPEVGTEPSDTYHPSVNAPRLRRMGVFIAGLAGKQQADFSSRPKIANLVQTRKLEIRYFTPGDSRTFPANVDKAFIAFGGERLQAGEDHAIRAFYPPAKIERVHGGQGALEDQLIAAYNLWWPTEKS